MPSPSSAPVVEVDTASTSAAPKAPFWAPLLAYKLVVFDLDGTLRKCTMPGQPCPNRPGEQAGIVGVADMLHALIEAGIRVAVATNQAGIAQGHLTLRDHHDLLDELLRDWYGVNWWTRSSEGGTGHGVLVLTCPHAPEVGCICRKPRPGMLWDAENDAGVSRLSAAMVGDMATDQEAAERAEFGAYFDIRELMGACYDLPWVPLDTPAAQRLPRLTELQGGAVIVETEVGDFTSADQGKTWTPLLAPAMDDRTLLVSAPLGPGQWVFAANPKDGAEPDVRIHNTAENAVVFFLGDLCVLRSEDGGGTWLAPPRPEDRLDYHALLGLAQALDFRDAANLAAYDESPELQVEHPRQDGPSGDTIEAWAAVGRASHGLVDRLQSQLEACGVAARGTGSDLAAEPAAQSWSKPWQEVYSLRQAFDALQTKLSSQPSNPVVSVAVEDLPGFMPGMRAGQDWAAAAVRAALTGGEWDAEGATPSLDRVLRDLARHAGEQDGWVVPAVLAAIRGEVYDDGRAGPRLRTLLAELSGGEGEGAVAVGLVYSRGGVDALREVFKRLGLERGEMGQAPATPEACSSEWVRLARELAAMVELARVQGTVDGYREACRLLGIDDPTSGAALATKEEASHAVHLLHDAVRAEDSWKGLIRLIERYWPAHRFVGESGDLSPRLVAAVREVEAALLQLEPGTLGRLGARREAELLRPIADALGFKADQVFEGADLVLACQRLAEQASAAERKLERVSAYEAEWDAGFEAGLKGKSDEPPANASRAWSSGWWKAWHGIRDWRNRQDRRIVCDGHTCSGKPRIEGTRLYLTALYGWGRGQVEEGWPELKLTDAEWDMVTAWLESPAGEDALAAEGRSSKPQPPVGYAGSVGGLTLSMLGGEPPQAVLEGDGEAIRGLAPLLFERVQVTRQGAVVVPMAVPASARNATLPCGCVPGLDPVACTRRLSAETLQYLDDDEPCVCPCHGEQEDAVEEMVAEREAASPGFAAKVEKALERRSEARQQLHPPLVDQEGVPLAPLEVATLTSGLTLAEPGHVELLGDAGSIQAMRLRIGARVRLCYQHGDEIPRPALATDDPLWVVLLDGGHVAGKPPLVRLHGYASTIATLGVSIGDRVRLVEVGS